MTRAEKLGTLGIDANAVTDEGIKKVFGRGADSSIGADLYKSSPAKYAQLKEASLLLNLYGS